MKTLKLSAIAILALLCVAKQGRADVTLTFDNLPGSALAIPQGYGGLHWVNFFYLDGDFISPSGYQNGVVSPNNVAYDGFGNASSFNRITPFTLLSAYFTAAWNDGAEITAQGYVAGNPVPVVTQAFIINTAGPLLVNFNNFTNINEAWFIPFDGTPHGFLGGSGEHFAIDNVTLADPSAVPEPAAVLLFGTVTLGVVSLLRRRLC
jgi:hypothetical protein